VDEWFKSHAWKACLGENLTRVRIPPSPPALREKRHDYMAFFSFTANKKTVNYQDNYQLSAGKLRARASIRTGAVIG
jgi:hypothetical protein